MEFIIILQSLCGHLFKNLSACDNFCASRWLRWDRKVSYGFVKEIIYSGKEFSLRIVLEKKRLNKPGARFSKVPRTFRARKAIRKIMTCYVVKGIKIKITAKFRASRRLRFEDTKRIMSPEEFRDFRETGPWSPI